MESAYLNTTSEGVKTLFNRIIKHVYINASIRRIGNDKELVRERDNLIIAEIGVWKGRHAEILLNSLDIEKIYLIDPYETVVFR
ncbi:hypothetical protein [Halonotius sp. GCM10025705]|uniref:hypothetical protein n=1 Tax=Halonotius sp. GCM10025705 TaxID=3252678 RepID=UPI003622B320